MDNQLIGVGLRPTHYPYLEKHPTQYTNWFEVISENFMNTEGRPLEVLLKIRERHPIGLHGVSLSIGSDKEVDLEYLGRLKKLIQRVGPILVSDHLCWSQILGANSHDLLPIPHTEEALKRIVKNLELVQNELGHQILLENISYYLRYKNDEMTEPEFITKICQSSNCGLLLDINNIYVNSVNHKFDPKLFIDKLPLESVKQIHIAGPSQENGFLFDTHSTPVPSNVWELLKYVSEKKVKAPIILEWDQNIPDFFEIEKEVLKAKNILESDVESD